MLVIPIINQTGGANGITRGLYVNPTLTAAADWRSIEWSNNSGWGLYGAGTANNYLGGDTYIGTTTTSATKLTIGGSETASSAIARGELNNTTLVASANNDVLVGLDISSSYTRSTFTGVTSIPLRITNSDTISGVTGTTFGLQINASQTAVLGTTGAQKYGLQIVGSGLFNRNVGTEVYLLHIPAYSGTVYGNFVMGAFIQDRVAIGTYNPIDQNVSSLLTIGNSANYSTYNGNPNTIYFRHNSQTSGLTAGIYASVAPTNVQSGIFFTRGPGNGIGFIDFVTANDNVNGTLNGRMFGTGNLVLQNGGTFTDAGFKLDVNGTARVSGASTFNGAMTVAVNQNGATLLTVRNSTSGTAAAPILNIAGANGNFQLVKNSPTTTAYKIFSASDAGIYNDANGDIGILNDNASGTIKFAAGGSSTAHVTIKANGSVRYQPMATPASAEAGDVYYDSSTNKLRCYNGTTWNDLF
jgi:hypothetical protein